eukprot:SAG31_NODE_2109_length_6426_cov_13.928244_7_plen_89_part_00
MLGLRLGRLASALRASGDVRQGADRQRQSIQSFVVVPLQPEDFRFSRWHWTEASACVLYVQKAASCAPALRARAPLVACCQPTHQLLR